MKPNEQEIERLLRNAPKPSPPAGLKKQLSSSLISAETMDHNVAKQEGFTCTLPLPFGRGEGRGEGQNREYDLQPPKISVPYQTRLRESSDAPSVSPHPQSLSPSEGEREAKLPAHIEFADSSKTASRASISGGWLRRWWPVLMPAAASLVCCVVLAFQQMEIRELQESIRKLSEPAEAARPETTTAATTIESADDLEVYAAKEREEITQLRNRVTQLTTEIAGLEAVQKGNEELRAGFDSSPSLSQEEMDALAAAKERAMSISCVNNLKQFGLAVRIWMGDNNEVSPPDIISMSNELNTPKILYCPSDTNRVVTKTWKDFAASESSYEYLTPSVTDALREPTRVQSRCPHHGTVGLCDGSVQMGVAKTHPEGFKTRDGKLYFELP